MATSTIPAAIDYIVTTVTALPVCAAPVIVCDGWPDARADTGVVIGVTPEDSSTQGGKEWAELGARAQWEEYAVPCIIWARRVGGSAMKDARDAAFAIFDAIDTALRTPDGVTLGGVLKSSTALLSDPVLQQTGSADQAGEGRMAEIHFSVVCRSRSTA